MNQPPRFRQDSRGERPRPSFRTPAPPPPEPAGARSFDELPLLEPLRRAVADEGYTVPTPIQARAIPALLEGRDLLGCAQTGTGKTAAFALPILQRLQVGGGRTRRLRALILTPTRELAAQIHESFRAYGRHLDLVCAVVFGGVSQHGQESDLRHGPEILVATPGRLLDLMGQGIVHFRHLEIFVLDEADRMLDMGFIHDVRKIVAELPERRQSLFFSATMPPEAAKLAQTLLSNPVRVQVAPQATPVEKIDQRVLFVDRHRKGDLLAELLDDPAVTRALVFTRTKHGADRVERLLRKLRVSSAALHGDKAQNARTKALDGFRKGSVRVLVATDIAARGIDVEEVSHVINYEIPNEPETYVHRIGRTARAGAEGIAISLCAGDERDYLDDIEKLIGRRIPVTRDHAYHSDEAERGYVDGVPGPEARKARKEFQMAQLRERKALGLPVGRAARFGPHGGGYRPPQGEEPRPAAPRSDERAKPALRPAPPSRPAPPPHHDRSRDVDRGRHRPPAGRDPHPRKW